MPFIFRALGDARFGVLALAWAVLGYFGLLDLGLGRALTREVALSLAGNDPVRLRVACWFGATTLLLFGTIMAVVSWIIVPKLAAATNGGGRIQYDEILATYRLLAAALPIVLLSAGLRGALEGFQAFRLIVVVRVPMAIYTYAAPLVALNFGFGLPGVVACLLAGRVVSAAIFLIAVSRRLSSSAHFRSADIRRVAASTLAFGSWVTVANVVGQVLVTLDRFVIGAVRSVADVAYYVTPYEAVTKLWMLPASIMTAAFPDIAAGSGTDAFDRCGRASEYVVAALLVPVALFVCFAPEIMTLWMGSAFAARSASVMQVLAVGVFVNSQVHAPSAYLQAVGRPRLIALSLIFQAPVYAAALYGSVMWFGATGAAASWLGRAVVEVLIASLLVDKLAGRREFGRRFVFGGIGLGVILFTAGTAPTLASRGLAFAAIIFAFGVVVVPKLLTFSRRRGIRLDNLVRTMMLGPRRR